MKTPTHSLIRRCGWLLAVVCWPMALPLAAAQESVPPQSGDPLSAAPPAESAADVASRPDQIFTLRADTELHLRMLDTVASNTHKRLDFFKLELVEPVMFEGLELIAAGTIAEGQVVHSAKAGMSGKAGELILATRLLRVDSQEIKLRSFNAGTGQNRYNLATGLGVTLGLPALFVVGKNISVPSGTDVYAKVASDHALPIPTASSMPPSTPLESQPTQEVDENENAPQ